WSVSTYPMFTGGNLYGVEAASPNDVWAVGYYRPASSPLQTLIVHWDGSTWTQVSSPNVGTYGSSLYDISVISAGEIWAVGRVETEGGGYPKAIALRWNGTIWSVVATPDPLFEYQGYALYGVDAVNSNDVWAVGDIDSLDDGYDRTLTFHWDGTAWTKITSPNIIPNGGNSQNNNLRDVEVVSSTEVWAVGARIDNDYYQTLILRWNGVEWQVIYSPSPSFSNTLYGITVVSPTEIWVVGDKAFSRRSNLSLRWDGTYWTETAVPNTGFGDNTLFGTDAVQSNDVWAVGEFVEYAAQPPDPIHTVAERYGQHVCFTPTATATPFPFPTGTPSPSPTSCDLIWAQSTAPNRSTDNNMLYGIDVISPTDIWAVGTGIGRSLTMHWDGLTWNIVESPNIGTFTNVLYSVSALASNDVWAVGEYSNNESKHLLSMHWDGAQWTLNGPPNVGAYSNTFYGVTAVASNDAWAVGEAYSSTMQLDTNILIQHWDGTTWTPVSNPIAGTLRAVTAVSASDIWAVGYYGWETVTLHWNGISWSRVPSPNYGGGGASNLFGVSAIATNEVWAVGTGGARPLTMRWNGTQWDIVPSPEIYTSILRGVSALASNDVWAVGDVTNYELTALHWDGTSWTEVPFFAPVGNSRYTANAVGVVSTKNVWAVGYTVDNRIERNAVFHYADPLEFTDVPEGSTFYSYVRCLVCSHILNGYPCGGAGEPCSADNNSYFRVNNSVTRGQLSKIVSNAAGFADPPGGQQFEDVAVGSTFFDFVGRLANRGIISGYACGGPGEPCTGP
ncbi:MAG: hypothetical protein ABIQ44_05400, partial [Chloroflexia bacterium]